MQDGERKLQIENEVDDQEKPPLPLLQIFLREPQLFQLKQLSSLKIFSSKAMTYGP